MSYPLVPACRDAYRLLQEIKSMLETDERLEAAVIETAIQALRGIVDDRYEAAR